MTKVIIWDDPTTKIMKVMTPAGGNTAEECVEKYLPDGITDYAIIDNSLIPTDRKFRNAWRKNGSNVKEDLTESKNHMSGAQSTTHAYLEGGQETKTTIEKFQFASAANASDVGEAPLGNQGGSMTEV